MLIIHLQLQSLVNCATHIIVHLEPHYNMSQLAEMVVVDFFNTLYFLDMECQLTSLNSSFSFADYWCFSLFFTCGLMIESDTKCF